MSDFNRSAGAGTAGSDPSTVSFTSDKASGTDSVGFTPAPEVTSPASTGTAGTTGATTSATGGTASGGGTQGGTSADASTVTDKAKSAANTLKEEAGKLRGQAGEHARGIADQGKLKATGALDDFSKMIDDAARTVDEKLGEQYGQYARQAAQTVSGLSDQIRNKEVDELVEDIRGFVRKSPAVAIGTAAALGFLLARVVKAGVDGETGAADPRTPSA